MKTCIGGTGTEAAGVAEGLAGADDGVAPAPGLGPAVLLTVFPF